MNKSHEICPKIIPIEKIPNHPHPLMRKLMNETKKYLFTVVFDCDSTLLDWETNDDLFASLENVTDKQKKEIEILTDRGMDPNDAMNQEESMKERFEIAKPKKSDFEQYAQKNKHRIKPAIKDIIAKIRRMGGQVLIVSGGNKEILDPLMEGIVSPENIYANNAAEYFKTGNVNDLHPISKVEVVQDLRDSGKIPSEPSHKVIMAGDGGSDLEVFEAGLADIFIFTHYFSDRISMVQKIESFTDDVKKNVFIADRIDQLESEIFDEIKQELKKAV